MGNEEFGRMYLFCWLEIYIMYHNNGDCNVAKKISYPILK